MRKIDLRVYAEAERLPRKNQLAYIIAEMAAGNRIADAECVEMVGNRIIDNAACAIASLNRKAVVAARAQALAHPRTNGASLFGLGLQSRVHAEWAAWANNTAVRELDFHDTFLAADYSHPGDNIPAILAVAEQLGIAGSKVALAILTAYEVQVSLVKAICLHKHRIDHVAHLAPACAAGLGTLLDLPVDTIYHAINQAAHVSIATRQSRKGQISSWKAYAPAHACKLAVEAVDRAMRGEEAPAPIWEGEDSIVAWVLDGKEAQYTVELPEEGEPSRAILETYTKEHSAEYQAQALIDLAFALRGEISDLESIAEITICTSHHTHAVIGTGSGDPQKFDPNASRETLDHSIMYIFAVALEDGFWHHEKSYTEERAHRASTCRLWKKIKTGEDPVWTARYHASDPAQKAFGGRVSITLKNGTTIERELALAHAHSLGKRPFARPEYENKFLTLSESLVSVSKAKEFFESVKRVSHLDAEKISELTPAVDKPENLLIGPLKGIF